MLRLLKYSVGSATAVVVAVIGLGGLNLHTYQRFTAEVPVAELAFDELAPRRFEVHFAPVGESSRTFILEGDEWQLDVRMIKWKDWLTFLGEEPLFRFDRLSGRFAEIGDARGGPLSMHALSTTPGIDLWAFAREAGDWLPGIDAAYGSSVYLPMRDQRRYAVTMSRTGLVARPLVGGSDR